ncbi:MAG: bifunctional hydroxymethylpyrimidine kinase/phosphomethylpyrimidine kinase [Actinobacteria bacterium]|jgi:hydroxymethylpyrimidine/phosphomethylpyrimidine kinase|nr:bifunctional hydroxymethylpyrimidine kinase/phosphomethylpyrimidine kinase [Actinomycetota bacterium]MCL6094886.1 bifunctional hydroxymethylpyrimidine kinase/phosphomethylpyrimidine kinase [Actinomycetota bacterium]
MTIAGSDSSGGAGIQADLATFSSLGVFGTTAITAITAQNTFEVSDVDSVSPAMVEAQVNAVMRDMDVRAVKTGMLAEVPIVELVSDLAAQGRLPNLVVDPVLLSSSGYELIKGDARHAYLNRLFPHALVITPNMQEASYLLDTEITNIEEMVEAAKRLTDSGARYVIVKGGHLRSNHSVDVVADASGINLLEEEMVPTDNIHGTGCTFSAAIAAFLAMGRAPMEAFREAKGYVTSSIRGARSWKLGKGHGPIDHFSWCR